MKRIGTLLVDDSATARQLIREILEREGSFDIVAEARNGAEAIEKTQELAPDLIIMDVHMPVMDGLEATKEIMARAPTPIVIVSAANNSRDLDLSLSATQAGALLALGKPEGPASAHFAERCDELVRMAKAMSQVKVVRRWAAANAPHRALQRSRRRDPNEVALIAIAASTGGPPALRRVLMDLPNDFPAPILIVQHIARDFAAGFAEWLRGSTGLHVKLATDGETAQPSHVYVAPDDHHLGVYADHRLVLSDTPPISGFRPSADFLFETAGRAFGSSLVGVVMSGMGADGAEGLSTAHELGAFVIAQDKSSSVVYGMAQEAVKLGAVDQIVPLEQIALRLVTLVQRSER